MSKMQQVELTYKSYDTEETLDIIFYRPLGYYIALLCKKLSITPNTVTLTSILFGVIAGHLFFYNDIALNITGIAFLVFAETLDSADGQLARLTGIRSKYGRVLDGFAGNIVFISIYVHVSMRMANEGSAGIWIIGIALISAMSHSIQSAMADLYRTAYLYFVLNKNSELDSPAEIKEKYQSLTWKNDFFKKFLMLIYMGHSREQELLSKNFTKLCSAALKAFPESFPLWVSEEYKRLNKSLLKYYNILTTNTRMIVLFISILTGYLYIYFIFEITVLNLLLLLVNIKQERNNQKLYQQINTITIK
ncbi:MAG: CDP-alcohol phosphatidyltransferase family protein [Ignavibacteriae bacterium]|nr:MAG: CDP-alcohol phosphatidyltransferase family protein [Ignavibacteriota bacterium]